LCVWVSLGALIRGSGTNPEALMICGSALIRYRSFRCSAVEPVAQQSSPWGRADAAVPAVSSPSSLVMKITPVKLPPGRAKDEINSERSDVHSGSMRARVGERDSNQVELASETRPL
jgi:hypothetical protein